LRRAARLENLRGHHLGAQAIGWQLQPSPNGTPAHYGRANLEETLRYRPVQVQQHAPGFSPYTVTS